MNFKGIEYYWDSSQVSGTRKLVYTDIKKDFEVKYYNDVIITDSIKIAKGYYILPEYSFLVDKLKLQGIYPDLLLSESKEELVTKYKFKDVKFSATSYESRQTVTFDCIPYKEELTIPKGSYYFSTDQPAIKILTHLLEPKSQDSFVQW